MRERPVTMSDVAQEAGVSKNTVSLALRHDRQIPEATRQRIAEIAARLGYLKNPTVAHLMAKLRTARPPGFQATLALINANPDAKAFTNHPTIPTYVAGCRRRAAELGYALDEFWLHDEELDGERLNRMLHGRNIRGAVVVGLMNDNRLPDRFLPTWRSYPSVVTGVRTNEPTLPFASVDHHALALKSVEHAIRLGYRRPALVLDHVIDRLVEGRFSAGVWIGQQQLPAAQRAKAFYLVNEARRRPELFRRWLEKEKPDLILTLYHVVRRWLTDLGHKVPRDIGLIQLEWRKDHADWAGMEQHNDIVGEAAIDAVIGMIHNDAPGIPRFPRSTLIGSSWVPGKTVRAKSPAPVG